MTAGWLDDVRGAPAAAALERMARAIAPGSRIAGLRRLGGGLGASMHRFDLIASDGCRLRLVLRRYPRRAIAEDPAVAVRSWQTLGALERLGVSAPRPVWADLTGQIFGTAAYVMTRLPGRSDLRPRNRDRWLVELGTALAALHRVRIHGVDLGFLRGPEQSIERRFDTAMRAEVRLNRRGVAVQHALNRRITGILHVAPVLCHGDYWAGNTLWLRGRLTAIVDWDGARIAHPGLDVGYCRMDLALQHGQGAADTFLDAYESATGMQIPQMFVWDLLGAATALPDPERWLPGFHELGRADLTPALARRRLAGFIDDALVRESGATEG
jgi:aminoglycoside phosphotransferase (APT) family kinase protein